MKSNIIVQIACLLIFAAGVQAEEVIVNTLAGYHSDAWGASGPDADFYGKYGDVDIAWQFTNTGPHYLTAVELPLTTFYFCPGNIADISVWSDTVTVYGHVPDQMLETVTITSVLVDRAKICRADFSGGVLLDPNTYYWVIVSAPGTELVKWFQNADIPGWWGAYRKDMSEWIAPLAGGYGGAMRVIGEPAVIECKVEFDDFARFALHWLESGCNSGNSWCSGADLNQSGDADATDLGLFVNYWLLDCPAWWTL